MWLRSTMDEARGLSSFSSVGYLGPNWNRTGIEKKREKKKRLRHPFRFSIPGSLPSFSLFPML